MPGVHTASAGAASDAGDDDDDEPLAQPEVARRMAPAKVAHDGRVLMPEG
jgi:hypothetical protein